MIQAFETAIDEDRKPLDAIVATFFPVLESIQSQDSFTNSQNYIPMTILICKIFYMSNQVSECTAFEDFCVNYSVKFEKMR